MFVIPNQRDAFERDDFVKELRNTIVCSYSEIPHAPYSERRVQFQNDFDRGSVRLSCANGMGPTLQLSAEREKMNGRYSIVSLPFTLNGVLVVAKGFIEENTLTGSIQLESAGDATVATVSENDLTEMRTICAQFGITN